MNYLFKNDVLSFSSYTEDYTTEISKEFEIKAKKLSLLSKIDDLFDGKIVNNTENRAALHPLCRKNNKNFLNEKVFTEFNENYIYESAVDKRKADNIVTIGIGGSFEGPKLLIENLGNDCAFNHIFITGSDPRELRSKIKYLDPKRTVFIVSSKSFTTDETLANLKDAISWSGDLNKFIAITSNKDEASKYNIKYILEFDRQIGGRYSIWSSISLPAFYEMKNNDTPLNNSESFCKGGHQADLDLRNDIEYQDFVKRLSFSDIWFHNNNNKSTRVVLAYIWKLRSLPNYFQQLEMESLGKRHNKNSEFKKTGQIIFGGYGPTAQHSYFQLLHQGTHDICADIIIDEEDCQSLAYAQAHTQAKLLSEGINEPLKDEEIINGNIPTNLFSLNKTNAYSLGYLIATWEHRTFITSVMLGINAFDQFGVNAGKIHTKNFLFNKN